MKRSAPVAILLATGILAGCSTSNPLEKKLDYKTDAPKIANSLEVPPDLTAPDIRNKYTSPQGSSSAMEVNGQKQAVPAQAASSGDVALGELAQRIKHFAADELDGPWLAARGGGGQFLLLSADPCSRERWQLFAAELLDRLARPIATAAVDKGVPCSTLRRI